MGLLSYDTGNASSLESSSIGRLANWLGDTKNLDFFSLCDGKLVEDEERIRLDFGSKTVTPSAF